MNKQPSPLVPLALCFSNAQKKHESIFFPSKHNVLVPLPLPELIMPRQTFRQHFLFIHFWQCSLQKWTLIQKSIVECSIIIWCSGLVNQLSKKLYIRNLEVLIYRPWWFLWYEYSHHGWFQDTETATHHVQNLWIFNHWLRCLTQRQLQHTTGRTGNLEITIFNALFCKKRQLKDSKPSGSSRF